MTPDIFIRPLVAQAVKALYGADADEKMIQPQPTRKEFEGDLTIVTFPLIKISKQSPEQTAEQIGSYLKGKYPQIANYNVVKGFLNIKLSDAFWIDRFKTIYGTEDFGQQPSTGKVVMVEYSSPNTNKPLHLGHIRNNLLGWSVARLMEVNGHKVIKTNIVKYVYI